MSQARRWRRQAPHCDGWWMFREDGFYEQRILVVGGYVADDEDWSQAMGREPDRTWSENYWEGNSVEKMTNGPLTSGVWMFEATVGASAT